MTDQVGFGFQADVVSTASLSHMLTGRVLKALSDGGVDTYAIVAAFWLGAKVPVRPSLSDTVHSHVSRRRGMQSVLSKALSIGWGHSVPVVEMTRTRAGTNALLVIGALSTGTPPFQAAQCFSELLSAYGMEAEMLPSVDVLKGLVTYLAPFVHDLGFAKVLQHIASTAARYFEAGRDFKRGQEGVEDASYRNERLGSLRRLGDATNLAKAIKQLVFTSERSQSHYMTLTVRGSWLPAFASHMLGMSVEVLHCDTTLWACGGDRGSIVFQLEPSFLANKFSVSPSSEPLFILHEASDPKDNNKRIKVEFQLEEALAYQVARWSHLDAELPTAICHAIWMLSMHLIHQVKITSLPKSESDGQVGVLMNGGFDNRRALEEVLGIMGVEPPTTTPFDLPRASIGFGRMGPATNGLTYMKEDCLERLATKCRFHYTQVPGISWEAIDQGLGLAFAGCHCESIGRLIHGFSCTVVALSRCRFNPAELRVQEDVISGDTMTRWNLSCLSIRRRSVCPNTGRDIYAAPHDEYYDHLGRLICPDYSESWLDTNYHNSGTRGHILGISGRTNTIYYSCIMQNDVFDDLGRMIQISTGRASAGGAFRNVIIEPGDLHIWRRNNNVPETISNPSLLVGGAILQPHHRPSLTKLTMDIVVSEVAICLQLKTGTGMSSLEMPRASFMDSITAFLSLWAVPSCAHDRDAGYEAEEDSEVAVDGFQMPGAYQDIKVDVLVFALTGNKLEQVLTCGSMGSRLSQREGESALSGAASNGKLCGVLQISSCLSCSIRHSKQLDNYLGLPCVIMGG